MKASNVLVLVLSIVLSACVKAKSPDSNVSGAGPEVHNFEVPNESDPSVNMQSDLAMGEYKATSVRITRAEQSGQYAGSKWTVIHYFSKAGDPANGDHIVKRGDWVGNTSVIGSSVHQQIPMTLTVVEDGGLSYADTDYHGASMRSDGYWSWVSSGSDSGADVAFLLKSNVVSNTSDQLQNPNGIFITLEGQDGQEINRMTHKVQTLMSTIETQIAAVKMLNENSFVLINYRLKTDGSEIYSEIVYFK